METLASIKANLAIDGPSMSELLEGIISQNPSNLATAAGVAAMTLALGLGMRYREDAGNFPEPPQQ